MILLLLRLANPLRRRRAATTAAKWRPNFWFSAGISSGAIKLDGGGEAGQGRLGDTGHSALVGEDVGSSPGRGAHVTCFVFLGFRLILFPSEDRLQGLEAVASASSWVLGSRPLLSAGPSGIRCLIGDGVMNSRKDLIDRVNSGVGRLELYRVGVEGRRGE